MYSVKGNNDVTLILLGRISHLRHKWTDTATFQAHWRGENRKEDIIANGINYQEYKPCKTKIQ